MIVHLGVRNYASFPCKQTNKHTFNVVKTLDLWSPNRYEIDLSYEILNIDFGQGSAKISEVKHGG